MDEAVRQGKSQLQRMSAIAKYTAIGMAAKSLVSRRAMSRSARLLDLVQALRRRRRPVAAIRLAEELGVALRTIYGDIDTLVAQGAPIEGDATLGIVASTLDDPPPGRDTFVGYHQDLRRLSRMCALLGLIVDRVGSARLPSMTVAG